MSNMLNNFIHPGMVKCHCGTFNVLSPDKKLCSGCGMVMFGAGDYQCKCCICGRLFLSKNKRDVSCGCGGASNGP